ncbi:MAG: DUF3786 domain-containing protein [Spirochaetes bacterium]|nr:MAG: DUF3786 domain-containing protein [Spirochaetota bacterium]
MEHRTNRERACERAAEIAAEELARADMAQRCAVLGLAPPCPDGTVSLEVFGRVIVLRPPGFTARDAESGEPARPVDRVLALHYLLNRAPVRETGELMSFRELPGGAFYLGPFLARTAAPLVKSIGNDIAVLRKRLDRFRWSEAALGDLGARIQGVGALYLVLAYRTGDAEFPPSAEVYFDATIKKALSTEDAAAMATRICLGLAR